MSTQEIGSTQLCPISETRWAKNNFWIPKLNYSQHFRPFWTPGVQCCHMVGKMQQLIQSKPPAHC